MATKKAAKRPTKRPKKPVMSPVEIALLNLIEHFIEDYAVLDEPEELYDLRHLLKPETSGPSKGVVRGLWIGQVIHNAEMTDLIKEFVKGRAKEFSLTQEGIENNK